MYKSQLTISLRMIILSQENIQEIENDGALNAFEDIFTHETYADMIEVWMMYVV